MRIVTLMENTACREDLAAEHGLSLYIETENCRILFDAGQSSGFAENAEKLGVDLKTVDFAVLSHGHYDHGGGMLHFLQLQDTAPVYVQRHAFEPHYNAAGRNIGLDPRLLDSGRVRFADAHPELAPGIRLCTLTVPPADTSGLQMEQDGLLKPEDFRHEQYLLVEEQGKRICISGCSHKGILNILDTFRPDILVGGFHFVKITEEAVLRQAALRMLEQDTVYYTGHCTGQEQYAYLKTIMGDRLRYIAAGTVLEL